MGLLQGTQNLVFGFPTSKSSISCGKPGQVLTSGQRALEPERRIPARKRTDPRLLPALRRRARNSKQELRSSDANMCCLTTALPRHAAATNYSQYAPRTDTCIVSIKEYAVPVTYVCMPNQAYDRCVHMCVRLCIMNFMLILRFCLGSTGTGAHVRRPKTWVSQHQSLLS